MKIHQEQRQRLNQLRDLKWEFEKKLTEHIELKRTFAEKVFDNYQIADVSHLLSNWDYFPDSIDYMRSNLDTLNNLWGCNYADPDDYFEYKGEKSGLWFRNYRGLSNIVEFNMTGKELIDQLFGEVELKGYFDENVFVTYLPLILTDIHELDKLEKDIERIARTFLYNYNLHEQTKTDYI